MLINYLPRSVLANVPPAARGTPGSHRHPPTGSPFKEHGAGAVLAALSPGCRLGTPGYGLSPQHRSGAFGEKPGQLMGGFAHWGEERGAGEVLGPACFVSVCGSCRPQAGDRVPGWGSGGSCGGSSALQAEVGCARDTLILPHSRDTLILPIPGTRALLLPIPGTRALLLPIPGPSGGPCSMGCSRG